ncbi:MAG: ankyrin repeat domain-containing protein, partial [Ignavibacteriaceae bacterium]
IIFFLLLLSSIIYSQDFDKLANAVVNKDLNALDSLLNAGIDINVTEEDRGATVLLIACSFKDYENVVSILISRGADVNFKGKDGRTPLMWAAGNSLETTKILLDNGADVKAKGDDGMNAFIQSTFGILSKKVSTDVMDLLLENGADINSALSSRDAAGWTALLFASINGDIELAEYLVSQGANVNHTSNEGSTALSLARQEKYEAMVSLLKEHGALD